MIVSSDGLKEIKILYIHDDYIEYTMNIYIIKAFFT